MSNRKQEDDRSGLGGRFAQTAIGMGYQFIAAILIFAGSGYYIDAKRGGGYAFTLVGVGLAFIYGGYEVWKLVRILGEEDTPAPHTGGDGKSTKN